MQKKNKLPVKRGATERKLPTKEQKHHASLVLQDFCDSYHLNEVKKELWEMVVSALSKSPSIYDDGQERSNLMFFYERVGSMMDALYLLYRQPEVTPTLKNKQTGTDDNRG